MSFRDISLKTWIFIDVQIIHKIIDKVYTICEYVMSLNWSGNLCKKLSGGFWKVSNIW